MRIYVEDREKKTVRTYIFEDEVLKALDVILKKCSQIDFESHKGYKIDIVKIEEE